MSRACLGNMINLYIKQHLYIYKVDKMYTVPYLPKLMMIISKPTCKKTQPHLSLSLFLECFPYVCPEPVLVKRCIFSTKRRNKRESYAFSESYLCALIHSFPHSFRCRVSQVHEDGVLCHTRGQDPARNRSFFESVSYVCPEPVLANVRF